MDALLALSPPCTTASPPALRIAGDDGSISTQAFPLLSAMASTTPVLHAALGASTSSSRRSDDGCRPALHLEEIGYVYEGWVV